jgi:4-hydroxy-tetrahydrodipicolinate reductase
MTVNVCVAGATGWTGRAIAEAVLGTDDLTLRSAVSRSAAGQDLGLAWAPTAAVTDTPSRREHALLPPCCNKAVDPVTLRGWHPLVQSTA